MRSFAQLEVERVALQQACDNAKTQAERNRLGQFATPPALARGIMRFAKRLFSPRAKVRFLDPAFGTGSFYSALLEEFANRRVESAAGFEIDKHYADKTLDLWRGTGLDLRVSDFTKALAPAKSEKFNLIVCNPPYVRHHHLTAHEKARLRELLRGISPVTLSGLSGLYCYFLLLADAWADESAICVWLIPSEFMDVNYGVSLKEYLLTKVTVLRVHRFDSEDVQFGDALVSSAVVCFRKSPPPAGHTVDFTFGGSLNEPKLLRKISLAGLRPNSKWNGSDASAPAGPSVRLSDIFEIKRGLATGNNRFFILTREEIEKHRLPTKFLRPILPSPRYLPVDEVLADKDGNPLLERQVFLLDCLFAEERVQREYPNLWRYLETGKGDAAKGYLCSSRSPWYSQEHRPAPPFLCTYMGRRSEKNRAAFRFILNHSKATAANVYLLLYPKAQLSRKLHASPELATKVWAWLNAISPDAVLGEGRVYGGGLYKLEPKELGNVPVDGLASLLDVTVSKKSVQLGFFPSYPSPGVIHP